MLAVQRLRQIFNLLFYSHTAFSIYFFAQFFFSIITLLHNIKIWLKILKNLKTVTLQDFSCYVLKVCVSVFLGAVFRGSST